MLIINVFQQNPSSCRIKKHTVKPNRLERRDGRRIAVIMIQPFRWRKYGRIWEDMIYLKTNALSSVILWVNIQELLYALELTSCFELVILSWLTSGKELDRSHSNSLLQALAILLIFIFFIFVYGKRGSFRPFLTRQNRILKQESVIPLQNYILWSFCCFIYGV